MNLSDYQHNKLAYESDCSKKTIHIHDFFWNMPKIRVSDNGKKIAFKKE